MSNAMRKSGLQPEIVICHNDDDVEMALDPFADNDLRIPIKQEYVEPQYEEYESAAIPDTIKLVEIKIKPDRTDESDHDDYDFPQYDDYHASNRDDGSGSDPDSDDDFKPLTNITEPIGTNSIPAADNFTELQNLPIEIKIENETDEPLLKALENKKIKEKGEKSTKKTKKGDKVKENETIAKTKTKKLDDTKPSGKRKGRPKSQEQHQCVYCDRQFAYASQAKVHMRSHQADKGYNCPLCEKSFARNDHYKQHINNVHKGEIVDGVVQKPVFEKACDICGKVFFHSGNLRKHMILHSGQRPYSCDECGRTFALSQHLKSHLRLVHSDEKNFQCSICGKLFNHSGNYIDGIDGKI